jgi:broad-specificity NMP kinase
MAKTFFINGVPGVGKTAIIPHLRKRLGGGYVVHDFDERGVPANVDILWRDKETKHWLNLARENTSKGISTIICGNSLPSDIPKDAHVIFILLDVSREAIEQRLKNRYKDPEQVKELMRMTGKSPEESIEGNKKNTEFLREACRGCVHKVIDTSQLNSEQVADSVVAYIRTVI